MTDPMRNYMLSRCEDMLTVELMLQIVCQQLPDATPGIIVEVMQRIFAPAVEGDDTWLTT